MIGNGSFPVKKTPAPIRQRGRRSQGGQVVDPAQEYGPGARGQMGLARRCWETQCYAEIQKEYDLLEEYRDRDRRVGTRAQAALDAWIAYDRQRERVEDLLGRYDEAERRIQAIYDLLEVWGTPVQSS